MLWFIYVGVLILWVAALWGVFVKAGEEGWKAVIPIWNILVLLKIVGRDWWWILLLFIPILNVVIWIIVCLDLAKSFGRGTWFAVGLIFFPFIFGLALGFGPDQYRGARAQPA